NVGIGTTGPVGQLSFNSIPTSYAAPLTYSTTTAATSDQNIINSYYLSTSPYERYFDIAAVGSPSGTYGGSNLRFLTNPATNNAPSVERMRIQSNGNIGIGTTNINEKLVASGAIVSTGAFTTGVASSIGMAYENGGALFLTYGDDTSTRGIFKFIQRTSNAGSTNTPIEIQNDGDIVLAQSLGNVGIGTTAPVSKLTTVASVDTFAGGISIKDTTDSYGLFLWTDSAALRHIDAGATGNMPIAINKGGGSVGIGTTNPLDALHVVGNIRNSVLASAGNKCVYADSNGALHISTDNCGLAGAGGDNLGNHIMSQNLRTSGYWISNDGDNEGVFVKTDGTVGIGTSSPGTTLDVYGSTSVRNSSGGGVLGIGTSSGATQYQYVNFGGATGGVDNAWQIGKSPTTGGVGGLGGFYIYDMKNSTTSLTVLPGGNVGIGTTSPTYPLEVQSSSGASSVGLVGRVADSISSLDFLNNGKTISAYIQGNGSWMRSRAEGGFHFAKGSTPIVTGTDFTIEGLNVGIGTTGPGTKLDIEGTYGGPAVSGTTQSGVTRVGAATNTSVVLDSGIRSGSPLGAWLQATDSGNLATNYNLLLNPNGGNVGIGTTNPAGFFHLYSTGSTIATVAPIFEAVNNTRSMQLIFRRARASTAAVTNGDGLGQVLFHGWDGASYVEGGGILTAVDGTVSTGIVPMNMTFYTMNTSGAEAERMRITPSGNVGIGITNPTAKLSILDSAGTTTNSLYVESAAQTSGNTGYFYSNSSQSGNTLRVYQDGAGSTGPALYVYSDGAYGAVFEKGNVGIGTTAPGAKLEITGVSGTYPTMQINHSALGVEGEFLRIGRTDSTLRYHSIIANNTSDSAAGNYLAFKLHNISTTTSQTEVMRLQGNGNVGIGTTSPNSPLTVFASNAKPNGASTSWWHTAIIDGTSAAAGVGGGIQFAGYKTAQTNLGFFGAIDGAKENATAGNEAGALRFWTNVSDTAGLTEKMRITSGGNVGIGTTAPGSYKLNVNGNINVNNTIYATSSGNLADPYINFADGSANLIINSSQSPDSSIRDIVFKQGGVESARFNYLGRLGIGTTSP
ncbi:MAG: hypothetical protein NTV03_00715, partial [Candidatus Nomurabacteria bacterium]|nr:hypothetical protein [Candidatus Nomurabacteria bacterium]